MSRLYHDVRVNGSCRGTLSTPVVALPPGLEEEFTDVKVSLVCTSVLESLLPLRTPCRPSMFKFPSLLKVTLDSLRTLPDVPFGHQRRKNLYDLSIVFWRGGTELTV